MNITPIVTWTTEDHLESCVKMKSIRDVLVLFTLPFTLVCCCLFFVAFTVQRCRPKRHANERFRLKFYRPPSNDAIVGDLRLKVKLIGRHLGTDRECSQCEWSDFVFSSDTRSLSFREGCCNFEETSAVCFAIPRERADSIEQFEKCLESCVLHDVSRGIRYYFHTSSSLTSSGTKPRDKENDYRIIIVRLHRNNCLLSSSIRTGLNRCKIFLRLICQNYWSLTAMVLCTNYPRRMRNVDHSFILVLELCLALAFLTLNPTNLLTNITSFREVLATLEISKLHTYVDQAALYLVIITALISFLVKVPFEVFLRVARRFRVTRKPKQPGILQRAISNKSIPVSSYIPFDPPPRPRFKRTLDPSITFKDVVLELKEKLKVLGLTVSGSSISKAKSSSSDIRQSKSPYTSMTYRSYGENYRQLPSYGNNYKANVTACPPQKNEKYVPGSSGEPAVPRVPYKRKEHIYEEIAELVTNDTLMNAASRSSEDDGMEVTRSTIPDVSTVLNALDRLSDRGKSSNDLPLQSIECLEKFDNSEGFLDQVGVEYKKDCRRMRYKGINLNSSRVVEAITPSNSSDSTTRESSSTNVFLNRMETMQIVENDHNKYTPSTHSQDKTSDNLNPNKMCTNPITYAVTEFIQPQLKCENLTLRVDEENRLFARGDCNSPINTSDTMSIASSSKSIKYRDSLIQGMRVRKAIIVRGKSYIDNFRDMAKGIVRTLSRSSSEESRSTPSRNTSLDTFAFVPSTPVVYLDENSGPVQQCPLTSKSATIETIKDEHLKKLENVQKSQMRKRLNHGVTLVYPEERDLSLLSRVRRWFNNLFGLSGSESDESYGTDSDMGCISSIRGEDVTRRNKIASKNRKNVVSDTFTYVTMDSSLLEEQIQPSLTNDVTATQTEPMPDILRSSIFKGVATHLPFQQGSFQSVSQEDVWLTSSDGKQSCKSRNINNNKTTDASECPSVSHSTDDDRELQSDLTQLLENPFSQIGDIKERSKSKSSSSQSANKALERLDGGGMNPSTPTFITPNGSHAHFETIHSNRRLNNCLHHKKGILFASRLTIIAVSLFAIVLASYYVSYFCRPELYNLWILYGLTTTTEVIGLDLLKAVICSLVHLMCFSKK